MTNYNFERILNKQVVKRVFNMFNHGSKEVRLVGGCVRDAFLSIKSNDLDFAANFEPKEIINILGKNDILYEDFVYIVIEDSSVKSKNLKNDDRISLCIATETKPQKWVQINGKAQLTKNNIQELVMLMAIHYLGKSEGAEYSKNVLKELDFIAVKILPDKVIGFDMAEE